MTRGGAQGESGQASIELVALLPVIVGVVLLLAAYLAGYGAREAADQAAVAAAVAQLQGGDPERAARDAAPGWSRTTIRVSRGRAIVTVRPRLPRFVAAQIDAERSVVFDAAAGR